MGACLPLLLFKDNLYTLNVILSRKPVYLRVKTENLRDSRKLCLFCQKSVF